MAYSRIKVWIAAEILTASDLNNEHNGHITNENDLDSRLIAEISARSTLETEHDVFYAACWNAGNSEIAANRVSNNSMKDNSVGFAELKAECNDPVVGTAGLRTLGSGAQQAMPGNTDFTPEDGSITTAKLANAAVTQVKLKTSQGEVSLIHSNIGELCGNLILPGGEYGFHVRLKDTASSGYGTLTTGSPGRAHGDSYVTGIRLCLHRSSGTGSDTAYAQQRYITASGEIHWIFILRNKMNKQLISMYQAPDHPCFGSCKPLLIPHPFLGTYDKTKHEIIVINPTNQEIEQMELETIVDDETKPDKGLLEVVTENYEIDESSGPAWPLIPVTVGLPKHVKNKKGEKVLIDYRFMREDITVKPIKKVIPKPSYIKVRKLRRKN